MIATTLFILLGIGIGSVAGYKYSHSDHTTRIHFCDSTSILTELQKLELPFAGNTECPFCNEPVIHSQAHLLILKDNMYSEICDEPRCQFLAENYLNAS